MILTTEAISLTQQCPTHYAMQLVPYFIQCDTGFIVAFGTVPVATHLPPSMSVMTRIRLNLLAVEEEKMITMIVGGEIS